VRLTVAVLLRAWEEGWSQALSLRVSSLLLAACPGASEESISELPVGSRDRELFALRTETFGRELVGLAACPECSEEVEAHFDISNVLGAERGSESTNSLEINDDGYVVRFRVPRAADLVALHSTASEFEARSLLLERCVERASHGGKDISVFDLPAETIGSVAEAMAKADPTAEVQLTLHCSGCAHRWIAFLDIASFLWEEINGWAVRLLRDIHVLARAYGWSEQQILSLSQRRRQIYLELCRG
jgi:hypothetical protein